MGSEGQEAKEAGGSPAESDGSGSSAAGSGRQQAAVHLRVTPRGRRVATARSIRWESRLPLFGRVANPRLMGLPQPSSAPRRARLHPSGCSGAGASARPLPRPVCGRARVCRICRGRGEADRSCAAETRHLRTLRFGFHAVFPCHKTLVFYPQPCASVEMVLSPRTVHEQAGPSQGQRGGPCA